MTASVVFDADTVKNCASRVLQAVADAADALPGVVTLPARQLLESAGATWDCEMVFVSVASVQMGLQETNEIGELAGQFTWPGGNLPVWTVTLEVGIVRCVIAKPWGPRADQPPTVDMYTADMVNISSDTAVLINAFETLVSRDNQPVPHAVAAARTQGGMHGMVATVTVEAWPG